MYETKYTALLLDLGGVIFDIDYNRTVKEFEKLGIENAGKLYSQASQTRLFDLLEKGLISEEDFYSGLSAATQTKNSPLQFRDAWNSLLIGVPEENADKLFELKKQFRLFLLSNTNIIHETAYRKMIADRYGSFFFDDVFEKMYLSHHLHLRKPEPEIFEYVLRDAGLKKEEVLFIDDSIQHVESAIKLGIPAKLWPKGKRLTTLEFD